MSVEHVNGLNKPSYKDLNKSKPRNTNAGEAEGSKNSLLDLAKVEGSKEATMAEKADLVEALMEKKQDLVEISLNESELRERISELIDKIKEQKDEIGRRIEAARILIMRRAYDNDQELEKTAESILLNESIDGLEID